MDLNKLLKIAVPALLCVFCVSVYYPGAYSNDSWSQYIHMTVNWYDDWFGPGMVSIWKLLVGITGQYVSLYLLMLLLYWLFIGGLAWRWQLNTYRYWVVMLCGVFFCFIPQYIMRDSLMSILWSLATLLTLRLSYINGKRSRIFTIALIILLLVHGLITRNNAIVALIPMVLALMYVLKPERSDVKSILLAAGLGIVLILTSNFMMYKVYRVARVFPTYKLKLLDIAGISKLSGENQFPQCLKDSSYFDYATVMERYNPATFDDIYWAEKPLIPPPDSSLNACVNTAWKLSLKKHPVLYLQNRLEGFLYYLRIKKRFKNEEYWNVAIYIDENNPLKLKQQPNDIRDGFKSMYDNLSRTIFYDPWLWLLINISCFVFAFIRFRKTKALHIKVVLCVLASGILYMLTQLPVYQFDRDFRYSYWNVFVTIIAIGLLYKRTFKIISKVENENTVFDAAQYASLLMECFHIFKVSSSLRTEDESKQQMKSKIGSLSSVLHAQLQSNKPAMIRLIGAANLAKLEAQLICYTQYASGEFDMKESEASSMQADTEAIFMRLKQ